MTDLQSVGDTVRQISISGGTVSQLDRTGKEIPLAARIFSVVDVWDALRSDRPYRDGWPEDKVREYIKDHEGTQFDPEIAETFLQLVE